MFLEDFKQIGMRRQISGGVQNVKVDESPPCGENDGNDVGDDGLLFANTAADDDDDDGGDRYSCVPEICAIGGRVLTAGCNHLFRFLTAHVRRQSLIVLGS
jgi:hypothetical protein